MLTDGGPINLDPTQPVAIIDLKKVPNGYAILDDDPYLIYDLGKNTRITSVKINGSVQ